MNLTVQNYDRHIHGGILQVIENDRKEGKLQTGRLLSERIC